MTGNCNNSLSRGFCRLKRKKKIQQEETNAINKTPTCAHTCACTHTPLRVYTDTDNSHPFVAAPKIQAKRPPQRVPTPRPLRVPAQDGGRRSPQQETPQRKRSVSGLDGQGHRQGPRKPTGVTQRQGKARLLPGLSVLGVDVVSVTTA